MWVLPAVLAPLLLGLGIWLGAGGGHVPVELLGYGEGTVAGEPAERGGGGSLLGGGPINVLVLGVDRRPESEEGGGTRSDTIMLARVEPKTGEIRLLSVPRDLLVEVAPGREEKINAAYAYGGVEQARGAIEHYTGIPVDHYVVVDFEGFVAAVDAIGGVKVNVEEELPEKHHIGLGLQRLNGRKALFYARYRGTEGGDLDRIERQQELVAALRGKALRWRTVKKMPELLEIVGEHVETDLGPVETISLARTLVKRGRDARMTSMRLEGTPATREDGSQVLVPDQEANAAIIERFESR